MKAPPETSHVPYNNIQHGSFIMWSLNSFLWTHLTSALAESACLLECSAIRERPLHFSILALNWALSSGAFDPTHRNNEPSSKKDKCSRQGSHLLPLPNGFRQVDETRNPNPTAVIFNWSTGSLCSSFGSVLSYSILDICILTARHWFLLCKRKGKGGARGRELHALKLCLFQGDACTTWTNV